MKEFCLLSNICGDRHCCQHCLKGCENRCMDDLDECPYLCTEEELPPKIGAVSKIKPEPKEPVVRRIRRW